MRSELFMVAEMLQRMEHQHRVLRPNAVDAMTALTKDDHAAALEASAEFYRSLEDFVKTSAALREHIVLRDSLGDLGESLDELSLRARGLVLAIQLDQLREELSDPNANERTRGWFTGRFHSIADVDTFVRAQLTSIHAMWLPYRRDKPGLVGMTEVEREPIYRNWLRVALRRLGLLRSEPDLARFIDAGLASPDLVEIHLACRNISEALCVPLDGTTTRSALRRLPQTLMRASAAPSTAHGTPVPTAGTAERR